MIDPDELASYLGIELGALNESRALLLIEMATAAITTVTGPLTLPYETWMRAIAFEVVARAYRNPSGYASQSAGPFSARRSDATAAAGIYLTSAEMAALRRVSTGSATVYSVVLRSPGDVALP